MKSIFALSVSPPRRKPLHEFAVSTKREARPAPDAVSGLSELLSNHFTYGAIAHGAIKISEPD
jgi:hypothetical protein